MLDKSLEAEGNISVDRYAFNALYAKDMSQYLQNLLSAYFNDLPLVRKQSYLKAILFNSNGDDFITIRKILYALNKFWLIEVDEKNTILLYVYEIILFKQQQVLKEDFLHLLTAEQYNFIINYQNQNRENSSELLENFEVSDRTSFRLTK